MWEIIEVFFDFFGGLMHSRDADSTKVRRVKMINIGIKPGNGKVRCKLTNLFKESVLVYFPVGKLDADEDGNFFWDLTDLDFNDAEMLKFGFDQRIFKHDKSCMLNPTYSNKYFSMLMNPESNFKFDMPFDSSIDSKNVKIELAFQLNRVNSIIDIVEFNA